MPYCDQETKDKVHNNPKALTEAGELNYFITARYIIPLWTSNPRYETIHMLRYELVTAPEKNFFLEELNRTVPQSIPRSHIHTAAALAFDEFYRRIGSKYEDRKIEENGDVYKEALETTGLLPLVPK